MTMPAGVSRKGLFSQGDYLAPLHITIGQPPKDVLNIIWRYYWSGSTMAVLQRLCWYGAIGAIVGIPSLIVLYGLAQPVPLLVRFKR